MTEKMQIEIDVSTRMRAYQKDQSARGRSLTLGQILLRLQEQYPEFKPELRQSQEALTKFRLTDDQKQFRIRKALREHAVEIDEIAEDTQLDRAEVKRLLADMVEKGMARKSRREFDDSITRSEQYFLVEFGPARQCEQCEANYRFRSPLKRFCSRKCKRQFRAEHDKPFKLSCTRCGNDFEHTSIRKKRCGDCWKGVKHGDDQG